MLHVDARRFARRDAEELRVELVDVGDEAAAAHVEAPRLRRVGVEQGIEVETVAGDFGDRVHAVTQQAPERLGSVRATGKATPDPDDRDGLRGVGSDVERTIAGCARAILGNGGAGVGAGHGMNGKELGGTDASGRVY